MQAYPFPWRILFPLAVSILAGRRRSFRRDARQAVSRLAQPPLVVGAEQVRPPSVIAVNHYTRPGLPAWWLALAVSAALPFEVHWVVTAAWRQPGLVGRIVEVFSGWFLRRAAAVYGFTTMPPMPPTADDTIQRAAAVRRVLSYARRTESPAVGLAPEGGDFAPPGRVAEFPPAAGRFILHLTRLGLRLYPAALDEVDGRLRLRFGTACNLEAPAGMSPDALDAWARCQLRDRMQRLLDEIEN
jgi:hypothetical protein